MENLVETASLFRFIEYIVCCFLAVASRKTILKEYKMIANLLALTFGNLAFNNGLSYFVSIDLARIVSAFVQTVVVGLLVVVWFRDYIQSKKLSKKD